MKCRYLILKHDADWEVTTLSMPMPNDFLEGMDYALFICTEDVATEEELEELLMEHPDDWEEYLYK